MIVGVRIWFFISKEELPSAHQLRQRYMVADSHTGKVYNDANETSLHNTDRYTLEADKETGYGDIRL